MEKYLIVVKQEMCRNLEIAPPSYIDDPINDNSKWIEIEGEIVLGSEFSKNKANALKIASVKYGVDRRTIDAYVLK